MEESSNSQDKQKLRILKQEIVKFHKLVDGHQKILRAIGAL